MAGDFLDELILMLSLNEWVGINQVRLFTDVVVPMVSIKPVWEIIYDRYFSSQLFGTC